MENIDTNLMNKEDRIVKKKNGYYIARICLKVLEFRYKSSKYLSHESIRDINKYNINDKMRYWNDL